MSSPEGPVEGPPWPRNPLAKRKMSVVHGPLVPRPPPSPPLGSPPPCPGQLSMPSTVYGSPGRRLEDTLAGLRLAPPRETVVVRAPRATPKPKVTSPQILEQHISKIISENAAIVETLDPLWTKRYMRSTAGETPNGGRKWSLDPGGTPRKGGPRRVSEGADPRGGSIIRDLLLRGEGGAATASEGACPKCGIWFRSGATLEVHLDHYCKAPNPPPKKRKISEPPLSRAPRTEEPPAAAPRPQRPTSLALGASALVGSTLVSPETPRPKKHCLQLYINGHAYTYLGLKCSTRSTYCCIYRPQPMYVAQEAHPGLSMYSDWRLVPAAAPLPGVSHQQLLSHYDSRQWLHGGPTLSACGGTPLVTHSSYWLFRSRGPPKDAASTEETPEPAGTTEPAASHATPWAPEVPQWSVQDTSSQGGDQAGILAGAEGGTRERRSQDMIVDIQERIQETSQEPIHEPIQEPNREAMPEPYQEPMQEVVQDSFQERPPEVEASQDNPKEAVPPGIPHGTSPKRVRIFEGGFKSNEAYTYVRGRGRGKYVCEECGIRCKKPSMLKKHIRTHTDLRPFSCHHCCFAFKTKGNLTKHMKSKAHHKKCTELGILPVPTTVDDSTQVDADTLARQEQQQREISEEDDEDDDEDEDDEDEDDEEDDEDDEDEEDDEEEEEEEEDDEGRPMLLGPVHGSGAEAAEEQEAAHSLLHLSAAPEHAWPLPRPPCEPHRPRSLSMDLHERGPPEEPARRYSMSSLGRDEGPMDLSTARQRRLEILPGGIVSGQNVRSFSRLALEGEPASEEGRCSICHKSFARASQLRMHVNIHYFERPFRCEACAVSFRTRGHLQKHRRSVSHYNRLNMNLTFGTPTAENPRPFKCEDCKIAFRIHGHLAKHLRSKMHILKLECLGKLPFGTYAEMERSGINLNEIDTSDCDHSLESLQVLAQKMSGVSSPEEPAPPHEERWEGGALRPCPLCGRLLKSAKSLQVHLHCDHQEAEPCCSICQRHFPSQAQLQQHLVTHTQPRPYVCDRCDAGFTSAPLLANHRRCSHPEAVL
ncbi:transcription factor sma-9 [Ixodes scapularis]|uniref:transcription factor sma-9 n=1 Tax=Ixodes scapularis TaxID=6945 RepID=UPI001A9FEA04|nr:transcription factor sma-9 [Ixodes scapularis]XP_042148048.1 transcription factor sma-9 [Ixodes scapularis]